MEATFPGVKVYIACKDDFLYLLKGEARILGQSELKNNKNSFAYIRELTCDMRSHPVENFMKESDIPCGPVIESRHDKEHPTPVLIYSEGLSPTKSLTPVQLEKVIQYAESKGGSLAKVNPENIGLNWARWVIGVENEKLFRAAALGMRVTLIPTGFGENLFKNMFPWAEILNVGE